MTTIVLEKLSSSDIQLTLGSFAYRALLLSIALMIKEQAPDMPISPSEYPNKGPWAGFGSEVGWKPIGTVNAYTRLFETVFWSLRKLIEIDSLSLFHRMELTLLKESIIAYAKWANKRWGSEWMRNLGIISYDWNLVLKALE